MTTKSWLPSSRSEQLAMAKKWDSYLTEQRVKETKDLGGLWLIRLFYKKKFNHGVHGGKRIFELKTPCYSKQL